jgi:hypothetical protein
MATSVQEMQWALRAQVGDRVNVMTKRILRASSWRPGGRSHAERRT